MRIEKIYYVTFLEWIMSEIIYFFNQEYKYDDHAKQDSDTNSLRGYMFHIS